MKNEEPQLAEQFTHVHLEGQFSSQQIHGNEQPILEGQTGRQLLEGKLVLKLPGPQQLNHRSLTWIEETQMHAIHLHFIYKTGQLTHDQNNRRLTDPGDAL